MSQVPSRYVKLHRRFLQILMNRRMILYDDAFDLFRKMQQTSEKENTAVYSHPGDMEQAVSIINKVIKRLNMEIRCAQDEITCKKYYLLVNTVENNISRKCSKFSVGEMEFFKKVLFEIVSSEDGCVSSRVCLNLNSSLSRNMTKSDIEALIEKFCKYLWLYQKNGKVCLSLLSIVELETLLTTSYEDYVSICCLCKHVVIQGYRCDNCLSLLHLHCVRLYTKGANRIHTCPVCSVDQPDMLAALQNIAFRNENDFNTPSTSSQNEVTVKRSARK